MSVYQYHRGETPPDRRRVVQSVERYARNARMSVEAVRRQLRDGVLIWIYMPRYEGWKITDGPYASVYHGKIPNWLVPYANERDRQRLMKPDPYPGQEKLRVEKWVQTLPPFGRFLLGGERNPLLFALWMVTFPVWMVVGFFYVLLWADKSRLWVPSLREQWEMEKEYGNHSIMGDMTLAHRDDIQWLFGTGRYSNQNG